MPRRRKAKDEDLLDGEDGIPHVAPTEDVDVDGVVLFADLDPHDDAGIEHRIYEYEKLFGGGAGAP